MTLQATAGTPYTAGHTHKLTASLLFLTHSGPSTTGICSGMPQGKPNTTTAQLWPLHCPMHHSRQCETGSKDNLDWNGNLVKIKAHYTFFRILSYGVSSGVLGIFLVTLSPLASFQPQTNREKHSPALPLVPLQAHQTQTDTQLRIIFVHPTQHRMPD